MSNPHPTPFCNCISLIALSLCLYCHSGLATDADVNQLQIPVQNYAVIDVSGTQVQASKMTLDDSNNLTFTYSDLTQAYINQWSNGSCNNLLTIPNGRSGQPDPWGTLLYEDPNDNNYTNVWTINTVTSSGIGYGDSCYLAPFFWSTEPTHYTGASITGAPPGGIDPPSPFQMYKPTVVDDVGVGMDTDFTVYNSKDGATYGESGNILAPAFTYTIPYASGTFIGYTNVAMSYLPNSNSVTVFVANPTQELNSQCSASGVNLEGFEFKITAANNNGWAIGDAGIWDSNTINPVTGSPVDLNDSNQVAVANSGGEGYLWEEGYIETELALQLPTLEQRYISNVQPIALSNQFAPPLDETVNVLATGSDSSLGAQDNLVIQTLTSGTWSCMRMQLPTGASVTAWNSINVNGVISAVGNALNGPGGDAVLLVPIDITPNPVPTSGVVRMRLKFGDSFNVPTLDDTSQMSITIDGTSVTWLRQDDNDPPAFYFLPPPHTSGTVDVVISGISIPNMPFLGANPPLPLKLTQFLVYTDDSTKGIKGFSDSIGVSIDEAESRAESNQNDNGLSAQDTADYFSELLDNQSNYGMDLMKIFMNGKSLDTSSGDPLQQMESTNDAKYQTALNDLGYSANGSGGGGGGPSPALALAPNSSGRIATGSTASNAAVVNLSTLTVETSGGQTGFVFMRWGNFNNPLTINFTIAGSASNGTDYSTIGSSVTIPANQASATVPIQSVAGATGKTVQITISASQSYQMGSAGSAQLSLP